MIEAFMLKVRCRADSGWVASIDLTNLEFCKSTAIEGSIGVKYYCKNLKEAIDNTLRAIYELNIPLHEEFSMLYIDEEDEENPDECPEQFLEEYRTEKKRLYEEGVVKDMLTYEF